MLTESSTVLLKIILSIIHFYSLTAHLFPGWWIFLFWNDFGFPIMEGTVFKTMDTASFTSNAWLLSLRGAHSVSPGHKEPTSDQQNITFKLSWLAQHVFSVKNLLKGLWLEFSIEKETKTCQKFKFGKIYLTIWRILEKFSRCFFFFARNSKQKIQLGEKLPCSRVVQLVKSSLDTNQC